MINNTFAIDNTKIANNLIVIIIINKSRIEEQSQWQQQHRIDNQQVFECLSV